MCTERFHADAPHDGRCARGILFPPLQSSPEKGRVPYDARPPGLQVSPKGAGLERTPTGPTSRAPASRSSGPPGACWPTASPEFQGACAVFEGRSHGWSPYQLLVLSLVTRQKQPISDRLGALAKDGHMPMNWEFSCLLYSQQTGTHPPRKHAHECAALP